MEIIFNNESLDEINIIFNITKIMNNKKILHLIINLLFDIIN